MTSHFPCVASTETSSSHIFFVKSPLPVVPNDAMNRRICTMLSARKRHSSLPDSVLITEKTKKFLCLGSLLRLSTRMLEFSAVNECSCFLPSNDICDAACVCILKNTLAYYSRHMFCKVSDGRNYITVSCIYVTFSIWILIQIIICKH